MKLINEKRGVFMAEKMSKGKIYCLVSAVLIFGIYILQKVLNIAVVPSRSIVILQAFAFSLVTAIVYFLLSKSGEPFYGILMAIFGIRMLPPDIYNLADFSQGANLLYYFVQKFAFVIFAAAIVKLYEQQEKPRMIKPIPIICTIIVVPFFNEISSTLHSFLLTQTGSMLYAYFSDFAVYAAAMIALLYVAVRCSRKSARLVCDFQIVALLLNFGRRACTIIYLFAIGEHISKSYYCWLLIYSFFIVVFYILRKRRMIGKAV